MQNKTPYEIKKFELEERIRNDTLRTEEFYSKKYHSLCYICVKPIKGLIKYVWLNGDCNKETNIEKFCLDKKCYDKAKKENNF
jgi:hypothetical protein